MPDDMGISNVFYVADLTLCHDVSWGSDPIHLLLLPKFYLQDRLTIMVTLGTIDNGSWLIFGQTKINMWIRMIIEIDHF